jgi:predicted dehydrogenase
VGIVDPSTDRVTQVLEQKRNSTAAASYSKVQHFLNVTEAKEALNKLNVVPKLIILAAPPHLRGTLANGRDLEVQVLGAFGSSPAIFSEKPVSTARPHEPLEVAAVLRKSGNLVSVGYMLRYLRVVQQAMHIIRSQNLQVMSVVARYTATYSRMRKFDWWYKSKQCGPIVEQATHFCDLCRYLGGEVDMNSVKAYALEHYEPAGQLSHHDPAIDESKIDPEDRIPRATTAFWYHSSFDTLGKD